MKWPSGHGSYCLVQQLWERASTPQVSSCVSKGLTSGYATSERKAAETLEGSFVCFENFEFV